MMNTVEQMLIFFGVLRREPTIPNLFYTLIPDPLTNFPKHHQFFRKLLLKWPKPIRGIFYAHLQPIYKSMKKLKNTGL